MRITILGVLLVLYPGLAKAVEVTLAWDANTNPDLCAYTLYQANCYGDKTGAWFPVKNITKDMISVTVNVEDGKNFAWYLTASDWSGNESGASNTVQLFDRIVPHAPVNFTRVEGEIQP